MRPSNRFTNRKLQNCRRDLIYEAVMTDLYLIGALEKNTVETIIGHPIADHLESPLKVNKKPVTVDSKPVNKKPPVTVNVEDDDIK